MSLHTSSRAMLCSYSSDSDAKDMTNKVNPPLYPITGQKFEDGQGCAVKNFEATDLNSSTDKTSNISKSILRFNEGKEFVDLDSTIESNDDASEIDLDEPDDKTIGICLPPLTISNKKCENGESCKMKKDQAIDPDSSIESLNEDSEKFPSKAEDKSIDDHSPISTFNDKKLKDEQDCTTKNVNNTNSTNPLKKTPKQILDDFMHMRDEIDSMLKESGKEMIPQDRHNPKNVEKQSKEIKPSLDIDDEHENQLRKELCQAQNTIMKLKNDSTREIVSNVIEINKLKEKLEGEKQSSFNYAMEKEIIISQANTIIKLNNDLIVSNVIEINKLKAELKEEKKRSSSYVQEIVKNVLEINRLKEELKREKESNEVLAISKKMNDLKI